MPLKVDMLPVSAFAVVDKPALNAYARARLADGDGVLDVAVKGYAEAMAADPDNPVLALRSYRQALEAGDAALALMEGGASVDVVFTDIVMPGKLNGVDLALALRRLHPRLPVVFASGYSDRRVLERWPGTAEILAKPFRIDDVARAISAARLTPCTASASDKLISSAAAATDPICPDDCSEALDAPAARACVSPVARSNASAVPVRRSAAFVRVASKAPAFWSKVAAARSSASRRLC